MSKVIFLDIDGVLVTHRSMALPRIEVQGQRPSPFARHAVDALNEITDHAGAEIVISSHWRPRDGDLSFLHEVFDVNGVTGHIVGCTPDLTEKVGGIYLSSDRSREIAYALRDLGASSWVAIDDDELHALRPRFIKTSFNSGLTREHAAEAIRLLDEEIGA